MERTEKPTLLSYALVVLLGLVWGTSFILIKRGLLSFTPMQVGNLRIFVAFLVTFPFALPRLKRLNRKEMIAVTMSGFVGGLLPSVLFSLAGTRLNSALSGSLNATTPFFTTIIAAFVFHQRIGLLKSLGLFMGMLGCVILSFAKVESLSSLEINSYAGFVILATIMYGININLIKYYLGGQDSLTISSVSLFGSGIISAIYLFLASDFAERVVSQPEGYFSLGCISLLGVVGTAAALIIFNRLIQITSAVFASSTTYMIPVFAIMWGIFDGEQLMASQIIGVFAVLAGVIIVSRAK